MNDLLSNNTEYRLRPYFLKVGVANVALFSLMGSASILDAYWNFDGLPDHSKQRALGLAFCIFAFSLLGVWLIAAYYREYLTLNDAAITYRGVTRAKVILIDEVTHIKWSQYPKGGMITIRSPSTRLKIHLGNFTEIEGDEIIEFFHQVVDADAQEGWALFHESRAPVTTPTLAHSRRRFIVIGLLFLAFSGIFIASWSLGLGTRYLIIGGINAAVAFWYLQRRPKYLQNKSLP